MKLFTLGPVELHPDTLRIASEPLPYFRTEEFSQYMLKLEQALKAAAGAGEGFRALLLTMSGTGAMEAAVANLLGKRTKHWSLTAEPLGTGLWSCANYMQSLMKC